MRFYTPGQMYRLARLAIKKRINRDPEGKHCPQCFDRNGTDKCTNSACLCHNPRKLEITDTTKTEDRFGRL